MESIISLSIGIIGLPTSVITTNIGYLPAKQTTVNPNWAAVMVDMLKKTKTKKGDVVAMGLSGSFPAMNLAAYAAAEALNLEVIAVSSASASTWDANIPAFTWLDMERVLYKADVISRQSIAASLGGEQDRALGTTKRTRNALCAAILRNKARFIEVNGTEQSIEKRMSIFQEYAQDKRIVAYINIGGGRASVGPRKGKKRYKPGLNLRPSRHAMEIDSVTTRFARANVPIIHVYRIDNLAEEYGHFLFTGECHDRTRIQNPDVHTPTGLLWGFGHSDSELGFLCAPGPYHRPPDSMDEDSFGGPLEGDSR